MNDSFVKCPLCKTDTFVERVKCLCFSCPPFICRNTRCKNELDPGGYEFYDDEEGIDES